jgi:hypothetical protein
MKETLASIAFATFCFANIAPWIIGVFHGDPIFGWFPFRVSKRVKHKVKFIQNESWGTCLMNRAMDKLFMR